MDDSSTKKWYVTFGSKYSYLMHPFAPSVHPDGVVVIYAPDYEMARELTIRMFGSQWSDLHEWDDATVAKYYGHVLYEVHWTDSEISDLVLSIARSPQDEWVVRMHRPAPERELIWGDSAYATSAVPS